MEKALYISIFHYFIFIYITYEYFHIVDHIEHISPIYQIRVEKDNKR